MTTLNQGTAVEGGCLSQEEAENINQGMHTFLLYAISRLAKNGVEQ